MRPQPLICVNDVEASSRWYQQLLGCQSAHGGPNYKELEARLRAWLRQRRQELQAKRRSLKRHLS